MRLLRNYGNKVNYSDDGFYKKHGKRLFDILLSMVGIIILFPVFLTAAIAIKIDSKGPIFFKQERLGKDGKVFNIIKFRTMVVGAEKMGAGLVISSVTDNRITKVGGFLRATSLDELPQFYNILKGDMSVVGPRPPVKYFPYLGLDEYPRWGKARFDMRPGITGIAQVVHRNDANWDERIRLDVEYIETVSFTLDIQLIVQTAFKILKQENVYSDVSLNKNEPDDSEED